MNDLNNWMIRAIERRMANLNSVISERPMGVKPLQQRLVLLEQETAIRKRLSLAADEEERCALREELACLRAEVAARDGIAELIEKCDAEDVFELIIHKDHGTTPDHSAIAGARCYLYLGGTDIAEKILPVDGKITRKPPPTGPMGKLRVAHEAPVQPDANPDASPTPDRRFGYFLSGSTHYSLSLDLVHDNWRSRDTIKGVQCRLANLGIYSGPIDGQLTWRTKEAIAYFQRIKGISVTGDVRTSSGELDQVLFSVLESEHGC